LKGLPLFVKPFRVEVKFARCNEAPITPPIADTMGAKALAAVAMQEQGG
jgi:hypothetical protein